MAVNLGATLVVEHSFTYPSHIYKRIEEEHVTVFPGVPYGFFCYASYKWQKESPFPRYCQSDKHGCIFTSVFYSRLEENVSQCSHL